MSISSLKTDLAHEADALQIVDKYREFLEEPIPSIVDNYELRDMAVILKVFSYDPKTESAFTFEVGEEGSMVDMLTIFSVAKVYAAGPESKYKKGDIVKMRDYEVASIENPAYSLYKEAMKERPLNAKVSDKVKVPEKNINNLMYYFQDKIFVLNPIKKGNVKTDYFIFQVSDANITNRIIDPYAFID